MIGNDWDIVLKDEYSKKYFNDILFKLKKDFDSKTIYPSYDNIFKALKETSFFDTKVVIIGQDPYHEKNQAMGLAFSVPDNVKTPPSLKNILKELKNDLDIDKKNNDLTNWSRQGVLLINALLTVEEGKPLSHRKYGWEIFTDKIISKLNEKDFVIYVLWGSYARGKKKLINKNHFIIESVHPSPLSAYRGFFGSCPFSLVNNKLIEKGKKEIDWK